MGTGERFTAFGEEVQIRHWGKATWHVPTSILWLTPKLALAGRSLVARADMASDRQKPIYVFSDFISQIRNMPVFALEFSRKLEKPFLVIPDVFQCWSCFKSHVVGQILKLERTSLVYRLQRCKVKDFGIYVMGGKHAERTRAGFVYFRPNRTI